MRFSYLDQERPMLLTLLVALGSGPALATPITYQAMTFGGPASGSLGGVPFQATDLSLTFKGDTADVITFSVLDSFGRTVNGAEILKGTATVDLSLPDGGEMSATFLPAAGIFVSLDSRNNGAGFGSFGVPPTDPSFPGQPGYPLALYLATNNPDLATYALASNFGDYAWPTSCPNFPSACAPAIPLPTTAGDLLIDPFFMWSGGSQFSSTVITTVPFASFLPTLTESGRGRFTVGGSFTLGQGSAGIDPLTQAVTLTVGSKTFSIPPGSFQLTRRSAYLYGGTLNRGTFSMRLTPRGAGIYDLQAVGSGVPPVPRGTGLPLTLSIGNDSGAATVFPRWLD
jgi:hypothetical protein